MKRVTNVTLDQGLMEEAREYGINLSKTLEEAVAAKVREERARRWREENRDAFAKQHEYVEKYGTLAQHVKGQR